MLKHLRRPQSSKGKNDALPPTPPPPASKPGDSVDESTPSKLPRTSDATKELPQAHSLRLSMSASKISGPRVSNEKERIGSTDAASATEKWTSPEDADGAYIRRTYAHFDARGVRGDGLVEGKEWTRERGDRAAWEASDDGSRKVALPSPPPPPPSASLKPLPSDQPATNASNDQQTLAPATSTLSLKASDSSFQSSVCPPSPSSAAPTPPSMDVAATSQPNAMLSGPSSLVHDGFAASTSSLGSHSEVSAHEVAAAIDKDEEIESERRELMTKIDRYGFFPRKDNTQGRVRIAILSENGLRSAPKRRLRHLRAPSRAASPATVDIDASLDTSTDSVEEAQVSLQRLHEVTQRRAAKEASLQEREALRARKWDRMLRVERQESGKPSFVVASGMAKSSKLRRRVYKGIPDRWRAAVWWALLQVRFSQTAEARTPASQHEANFWPLQQRASSHDVQIDLDVPRTISGHILFHTRYGQGQRALFHVLHAFSLYCSDCAYCQGMGPIAATLLVYFSPERAYAALVELHNDAIFGMHQTFLPGFPGLVENFYVQHALLGHLSPDICKALDESGVVASAYATKWYITLFTNVVPFATQLRLWDAYFLHGRDVLVVTAVAILWSLRAQLLHASFEISMGLLGREFVPVDDDLFLEWIFTVMQRDDTRKCLASARKQWAVLVAKGEVPIL